MDMNIRIRQAKPEDLDEVYEVEQAGFSAEEAATKEMLKERIETSSKSFFVAETREEDGQERKIVGLIDGCLSDEPVLQDSMYKDVSTHQKDGRYQIFFGLTVLPEVKGKGVAEMLVKYVIQHSKEAGHRGIAITCKEKLIGYFEKFGFRNEGISKSNYLGEVWYDMKYRF